MTTQDPELSAALGWPGGISDPVLDRKALLQQVAALRAALAQQAEPVQEPITRLFGTLPVHDAQQAEPVEPVAHRVVAGALFDFMGWLTSRRERLVLSSTDDAAPAVDAIKDFAEMRGLSLDDAKVQDWNAALEQQAEPVGQLAELQAMLRAEVDRLIAAGIQPQRKLVPLTEEEIMHIGMTHQSLRQVVRAVELAHGIKEN